MLQRGIFPILSLGMAGIFPYSDHIFSSTSTLVLRYILNTWIMARVIFTPKGGAFLTMKQSHLDLYAVLPFEVT